MSKGGLGSAFSLSLSFPPPFRVVRRGRTDGFSILVGLRRLETMITDVRTSYHPQSVTILTPPFSLSRSGPQMSSLVDRHDELYVPPPPPFALLLSTDG